MVAATIACFIIKYKQKNGLYGLRELCLFLNEDHAIKVLALEDNVPN